MMDRKVKNLWKNIQEHGRLLESYSKKKILQDFHIGSCGGCI